MNLKEIYETSTPDSQYWGITIGEVTDDFFEIPHTDKKNETGHGPEHPIRLIGFDIQKDDLTKNEDAQDVFITWRYDDPTREVIVEINPNNVTKPSDMIKIIGNSDISLSILPSDDDYESWYDALEQYTREYCSVTNYTRHLYPVTNYMEYLFAEEIAGATALTPDDSYVKSRFSEKVPEDNMNEAKDRMRKVFYEIFGGKEGFRALVFGFVNEFHEQAEETVQDIKASRE